YQSVHGSTVFDFHNSTVGQIGSKVQESEFLSRSAEMIVQNLQNQRDSVSGVSLDEEITNLIKHEQAYQAAARMVSTVDEMMRTVLNML
ncbi:MAG: flagellar hook-associated protein FlgK, partial [Candidatus Marinimicrobia bacterium]|nr:flagellar hook-associated protein FlgK [Candidatus Neomarinimicrobiota bacterium]